MSLNESKAELREVKSQVNHLKVALENCESKKPFEDDTNNEALNGHGYLRSYYTYCKQILVDANNTFLDENADVAKDSLCCERRVKCGMLVDYMRVTKKSYMAAVATVLGGKTFL